MTWAGCFLLRLTVNPHGSRCPEKRTGRTYQPSNIHGMANVTIEVANPNTIVSTVSHFSGYPTYQDLSVLAS